MGFLTSIKANKAYRLQQKGMQEEARKLYEEAFEEAKNHWIDVKAVSGKTFIVHEN